MSPLHISVFPDHEAMSRAAADLVAAAIRARPDARIVAPTGRTPTAMYRELARRRERGELDASRLTVYQLDEYEGVAPEDHRSLLGWLLRDFAEPLGIPPERVVPVPRDGDPEACATYDAEVEREGGYDLAILGIGPNGHVGFNEPPSDADAPTRLVALSRESRRSNARYWGAEEVPRRAVTIGMRGLLAARSILLLASGSAKREIVRRALLGPVTPEVPASLLRTVGLRSTEVRILLDRDAWEP
ncbi:MAG: glucosamine-6-phosphate deaminase [Actinomycetota bacterium]|nr:MAG: glucosamine-6-phosphate deaminase [Actinomycetota bacterium]